MRLVPRPGKNSHSTTSPGKSCTETSQVLPTLRKKPSTAWTILESWSEARMRSKLPNILPLPLDHDTSLAVCAAIHARLLLEAKGCRFPRPCLLLYTKASGATKPRQKPEPEPQPQRTSINAANVGRSRALLLAHPKPYSYLNQKCRPSP